MQVVTAQLRNYRESTTGQIAGADIADGIDTEVDLSALNSGKIDLQKSRPRSRCYEFLFNGETFASTMPRNTGQGAASG